MATVWVGRRGIITGDGMRINGYQTSGTMITTNRMRIVSYSEIEHGYGVLEEVEHDMANAETPIGPDEFRALLLRDPQDILGSPSLFPPDGRIDFDPKPVQHPVAQYFTPIGRSYAASNRYAAVSVGDLSRKNPIENPRGKFRYGHIGVDWPAPMCYEDGGGMGVSHPFTPLGYMLYHDRRNNISLVMDDLAESPPRRGEALVDAERIAITALLGGSAWATRYLLEVGRARDAIASGDGKYDGLSLQRTITRACSVDYSACWCHMTWHSRLFVDPSGHEVATMVMKKRLEECTPEERYRFSAIAEAADDFGERWKRGEWYKGRGASAALKSLLGV